MKITFKYITLSLLAGASLLTSCEDFLDREPLDSVTPDTYLKNESQLAAYAINAYSFNIHSGYNGGRSYQTMALTIKLLHHPIRLIGNRDSGV